MRGEMGVGKWRPSVIDYTATDTKVLWSLSQDMTDPWDKDIVFRSRKIAGLVSDATPCANQPW
jgi:hypothetical protein